jgi:hypothetical protein
VEEYGPILGVALLVVLLAVGFYVAYKRPPREVADRYWRMETVYHHECVMRDDRGTCTSEHTWYTEEPAYYAVSADGATCNVGSATYRAMRKGDPVKCWQPFGWSGGAMSDSLVVASRSRESLGASW